MRCPMSWKLLLKINCLVANLLLFSLFVGMAPALAQEGTTSSDSRLIESLRSYIPHLMRQRGIPGLNIALARRGKVIWEEGFGYADLNKKIKMTPQTVMHSGSMGKTYTATAVMQLVEKGIIDLFDPINKYLKEFKIINPLGEREITFYDLLTHRSGLAGNAAGSEFDRPKPLGEHLKERYAKQMADWYQDRIVPLWSHKVGEKFDYSNLGMATLGYLVEVINPEGLSFSEYVQKHIMDPLGMTSSQYPPVQDAVCVKPDIFARFSKGYAQFGPLLIPTPTIYFADYPAGTVVTTPGDHIRLLLAYLNKGNYSGFQLLKPETVELMLTPQIKEARPGTAIGLVWFLWNWNKPDYSFGHGGAHMFGWRNLFRAYPIQDFAMSVATNRWDMVRYDDPTERADGELIAEFISSWLKNEQADLHGVQPPATWAWKTSYAIGLMMAERLKGFLGIKSPVTQEMVEEMAKGAKVQTEAEIGISIWDPAGFRAGVEDMLRVEMTPAAIRAFLRSKRLRVAPEELDLLFREIGGRTAFPVPYPGF